MQAKTPKLLLPQADIKLSLGIVVAMGLDRAIGQQGTMPWYVPEDLQHFKQHTLNSCVIMGRRTFESIGRPLPARRNIVITQQQELAKTQRVEVASSLAEALALAHDTQGAYECFASHQLQVEQSEIVTYKECFVIGGARLFAEALTMADKLVLTYLNARFPDADVFFPEFDSERFSLSAVEPQQGWLHSEATQPSQFTQIRYPSTDNEVTPPQYMGYRFATYVAR